MFYAIATAFTRAVLRLLTRYEVHGLEFVPIQGPLVLVSNHISWMDPPTLGGLLPRKIRFMAKEDLFKTPVVGWVVAAYEAFPVRRGEADRQALRTAIKLLDQGQVIGMFPEGTRSKAGQIQPGHAGAALVALRSGAPVLPIALTGTQMVWRWPNILLRPKFAMTIGPVFHLERQAGASSHELLDDGVVQMMRHIAVLLPPEYLGTYGESLVRGCRVELTSPSPPGSGNPTSPSPSGRGLG